MICPSSCPLDLAFCRVLAERATRELTSSVQSKQATCSSVNIPKALDNMMLRRFFCLRTDRAFNNIPPSKVDKYEISERSCHVCLT
eukprot:1611216-Amphidinium_carterae.1